jgi:hypothetical protein
VTAKLGLTDNIAANLHLLQEDIATNQPVSRIRNTQIILRIAVRLLSSGPAGAAAESQSRTAINESNMQILA